MHIKRFEDIIVWQKSQELAVLIHLKFKYCKDLSFRDQIFRATLSISNNIAEGFDRETDKELIRYLYIAKGSTAEVRSMLYLAEKLDYLTKEEFKLTHEKSNEISKMLFSFIKKLSNSSTT